jgi:hypothetical protein
VGFIDNMPKRLHAGVHTNPNGPGCTGTTSGSILAMIRAVANKAFQLQAPQHEREILVR